MKKSDIIIRQLHQFHRKFDSVFGLRATLVEELKEHVPDSTMFRIGYEDHKKEQGQHNKPGGHQSYV